MNAMITRIGTRWIGKPGSRSSLDVDDDDDKPRTYLSPLSRSPPSSTTEWIIWSRSCGSSTKHSHNFSDQLGKSIRPHCLSCGWLWRATGHWKCMEIACNGPTASWYEKTFVSVEVLIFYCCCCRRCEFSFCFCWWGKDGV